MTMIIVGLGRHTQCSPAYWLKRKTCDLLAECKLELRKPEEKEEILVCELKGEKNKSIKCTLVSTGNDESKFSQQGNAWELVSKMGICRFVDENTCARCMV